MTGLSGDRNLALQVFQLRVKVFCTLCERGTVFVKLVRRCFDPPHTFEMS